MLLSNYAWCRVRRVQADGLINITVGVWSAQTNTVVSLTYHRHVHRILGCSIEADPRRTKFNVLRNGLDWKLRGVCE